MSLPGLTVLLGGMWIVNLNYWGCNQYITQRALGADLKTARNGILCRFSLSRSCLSSWHCLEFQRTHCASKALPAGDAEKTGSLIPIRLILSRWIFRKGLKGLPVCRVDGSGRRFIIEKRIASLRSLRLLIFLNYIGKNATEKAAGKYRTLGSCGLDGTGHCRFNSYGNWKKGGFHSSSRKWLATVSRHLCLLHYVGFSEAGPILMGALFKWLSAASRLPCHAQQLFPVCGLTQVPFSTVRVGLFWFA